MATTYDPKCHELAEHVLSDYDTDRIPGKKLKADTHSLACAIQAAIENWKEDSEREAIEAEAYADEMRSLRGYSDEERARI